MNEFDSVQALIYVKSTEMLVKFTLALLERIKAEVDYSLLYYCCR